MISSNRSGKHRLPDKYLGQISAGAAFLVALCFFQFFYPYHLFRREQLNLFIYDWDYIAGNYKGIGLVSRFIGDFVDQFLFFPVLGPVLVALILTAIGFVAYRICRKWLGKRASLGIATLIFAWSFMRETDNQYLTQYSLAVLCYLSLILAGLQFRKAWLRSITVVLFLAVGVLAIGKPYNKYYGKLWGTPSLDNERIIAMDAEGFKGHWDKVLKLGEKDIHVDEACYYCNLATAMKGQLGSDLFKHSQHYTDGLFLWVSDQVSQFTNSIAGEVWYNLGDMTLAEQSTVVAIQQSPKHTGARYFVRMAQITLITGEYGSAQKYLYMLSKTLAYRQWALRMMPDNHDQSKETWLKEARAKLPAKDFVYGQDDFRPILKGLLAADADNTLARECLLAYDLLRFDLDAFMQDYADRMVRGTNYQEAILIYLSMKGTLSQASATQLGVDSQTLSKFNLFGRYPDSYADTYWYYYMQAMQQ